MALTESSSVVLGQSSPDFSLPGTDGKTYSLADFVAKKVLVIVFMCNHCPYVQACVDRLSALAREFDDRGVAVIGINSNDAIAYPEDSFAVMQLFVAERHISFPYLCDETQQTARAYGAACTPDIFVYDDARHLRYHGRMDDNWKDPSKVTRHDVRDAIEALLDGRAPNEAQVPSMGCSIKWKECVVCA